MVGTGDVCYLFTPGRLIHKLPVVENDRLPSSFLHDFTVSEVVQGCSNV